MSKVTRKYWASLQANHDFIEISTQSGYRSCLLDLTGEDIFLDLETSNHDLGVALLKCLSASRFIDPDDDPDFFDYRKREAIDYPKWLQSTMERFGYKIKKNLFKNMISCSIVQSDEIITIVPLRHVKLEAWEGDDELTEETVSKYNSPEEIGAALRRAMEKCIP
jgi:hypothetical protein